MNGFTRDIREYTNISFRATKGKIDIFHDKQFHSDYELYLLLDGSVEFISDRVHRSLFPYSLVIIPPCEYHRFLVKEGTESRYERCVLNVAPELLGGNILKEALDGKSVLSLSPEKRIVSDFLYLKQAMTEYSEGDFKHLLSAVATDIVFLIKNTEAVEPPNVCGFPHSISLEVVRYIRQNLRSAITLADIAAHLCLSISSLSHHFKADFGVSIKQYLTEKRMNEIERLLKEGRKPQELSYEFGYANYVTFYRSYRGYFGRSPSEDVKRIKQQKTKCLSLRFLLLFVANNYAFVLIR